MNKLRISNVFFNILTIVTAIAVIFVAFNFAVGAKGYAVTSNSMAETLKRGDVVYSKKVPFDELKVGDIVTVGSEYTDDYFTHRIVAIDKENQTITTKGDNNPSNDPVDTPAKRIVGKVWYSIPLLGFLTIAFGSLSQTKGLIILAVFAAALIAINMIISHLCTKKNGGGNNE